MEPLLNWLLWLAGFGHFLILAAAFQVPKHLGWKNDLPKLSRFNEKLFKTYSAFTVLTIVAFGTLTLVFHGELVKGNAVALGLACFIGIYWLARLIVDFAYYGNDDWPQGKYFAVGHTLLNLLFLFLVCVNFGIIAWHSLLK